MKEKGLLVLQELRIQKMHHRMLNRHRMRALHFSWLGTGLLPQLLRVQIPVWPLWTPLPLTGPLPEVPSQHLPGQGRAGWLPGPRGCCSKVCSCVFTVIRCLIVRLGRAAVFACGLNDDLSRSSLATPHSPAWQRQPQGERWAWVLASPQLLF